MYFLYVVSKRVYCIMRRGYIEYGISKLLSRYVGMFAKLARKVDKTTFS